MLIQEAIKSGKPFSRKSWSEDEDIWLIMEQPNDMVLSVLNENFCYELLLKDILAEDWYTKQ